jgi:hypothetical protein
MLESSDVQATEGTPPTADIPDHHGQATTTGMLATVGFLATEETSATVDIPGTSRVPGMLESSGSSNFRDVSSIGHQPHSVSSNFNKIFFVYLLPQKAYHLHISGLEILGLFYNNTR